MSCIPVNRTASFFGYPLLIISYPGCLLILLIITIPELREVLLNKYFTTFVLV